MTENKSPWVEQLKKSYVSNKLDSDIKTNVLVIGAGISGVTTSYFILKNTDLNVTLVDARELASGASGHNAGQLVSYFEKQLYNMVLEFGFDLAVAAQKDINSTWYLIDQIFQETGIPTKVNIFTGYAGIQSFNHLILCLQNLQIYKKAGLIFEKLSISDSCPFLDKIPKKYHNLFSIISKKNLLEYLETKDDSYFAMLSLKKGVMNSAEFCEDLFNHMYSKYQDRINFYEKTEILELNLKKSVCEAKTENNVIRSQKVILCTNGFEKIKINNIGQDIDTKFHHLVNGCVGYMAGYLEEDLKEPIAISYLPKSSRNKDDSLSNSPYFYLTRRDFEIKERRYNLICIGGPEKILSDTNLYKKEHPYASEAQNSIDDFLHKTYKNAPKGEIKYKYKWHGLMGYTTNGIRLVGPEPLNPNLYYNLGCNGIGILPSIFGANKISLMLQGVKFGKSIFDPIEVQKNYSP